MSDLLFRRAAVTPYRKEDGRGGKCAKRQRRPGGGLHVPIHGFAAEMGEQEAGRNDPREGRQGKPPKVQDAQSCSVADHVEGQERQQSASEHQKRQCIL